MSDVKIQISKNLETVKLAVQKKASLAKRPVSDIKLIAVSKKQPIERIHAMLACGHRLFGENRVQEAAERWTNLKPSYPDLKLHLIGPLQTNKVKEAVSLFDVIETVDRPKLVKAIATEVKKQNKEIDLLIQVNTGEEPQKSGVMPADLPALLIHCKEEGLSIKGLMCIPPSDEPAALHFAFLKKLATENKLSDLSMGMSNDFEKAIPLGATYIRVGSKLFGDRLA